MAHKYVYLFSQGNGSMQELLGGKGAALADLTGIGVPIPQGFTVTTEACAQYYADGRTINDAITSEIMEYVAKMEERSGKGFGDLQNPLLVSVRAGSRVGMPGLMDPVVFLGLNDEVVAAMIEGNPDPQFAHFMYDSYRRFIQIFSHVVMDVPRDCFDALADRMEAARGAALTTADLKALAVQFKQVYREQLGTDFPSDPTVQLYEAIRAAFRSWDSPRAAVYRRSKGIPYSWGTAVHVMPMVFGNLDQQSGTGVVFTRDPGTGEKRLTGEFLANTPDPMPIARMEQLFPDAYAQLIPVCRKLERHYRDMLDIEFTVERGKLYLLQCRSGKRTARAAAKIAADLLEEGVIDQQRAREMAAAWSLDT